ncbi:hypothetical protein Tco_0827260 [Tanacetum coccineum]
MILHESKNISSEEKVSEEEPPAKKLKLLIPTPKIPSLNPLSFIILKHLLKPLEQKIEPTPPRDMSKCKRVPIEEPMKELIPFIEEEGSEPKMSCLKSFVTPYGILSKEDFITQLKEMKRLADLKAEKEKSQKSLMKILNRATIKAQTNKIVEHEANRVKMMKEYNNCINGRVDELPITKISYRDSSSHEASMRITRGNDPLNIMVYEKFRLNILGFSEWLEIQALASKSKSKLNDQLLKNLRAKFKWVVTQAKGLGISPPLELRNLAPPPGVKGRRGLVIRDPVAGIFYNIGNFELVFQRQSEFHLATIVQLVRLQNAILGDTLEEEEMYKLMELEIESRGDVVKAREIVKDNLDGMGQHM